MTVLLILLWYCFLSELALSLGILLFPTKLLPRFKMTATPDVLFLGHIVGWFCLLVTGFCALALYGFYKGDPFSFVSGFMISFVLAVWWIVIGLSLFFKFSRKDNLILDTLKGVLILVALYFVREDFLVAMRALASL